MLGGVLPCISMKVFGNWLKNSNHICGVSNSLRKMTVRKCRRKIMAYNPGQLVNLT